MKKVRLEKNRGIALLMTIVISFIVVAIGLAISSVAIRELNIASTLREGMRATYAADSGIECIRYWSTKDAQYFSIDKPTENPYKTIRCGGKNIDVAGAYKKSGGKKAEYSGTKMQMPVNGSEAELYVSREEVDNGGGGFDRLATLVSKGFNRSISSSEVTAFREYEIEDNQTSSLKFKDIIISMDVSDSIGGSRSGEPRDCPSESTSEIDCALTAAQALVSAVLAFDDVRVGMGTFDAGILCADSDYLVTNCPNNLDEHLDVVLTDSSNKDAFFGDSGLFAEKNHFQEKYYRYGSASDTTFNVPAIFAFAELTGREVRPRSVVCGFNDNGTIATCPNDGGVYFPIYDNLPSGGRDRPDNDYPDAYIVIGDFGMDTFYNDRWRKEESDKRSHEAYRDILKQMSDDGIELFFVLVGFTNNRGTPGAACVPDSNKIFDLINCADISYNYYIVDDYELLEETLVSQVFSDLSAISVVPIIEK